MYPHIPYGMWQCPAAGPYPEQVEDGKTCVLNCDDGTFGGMITCTGDGTWDESHFFGCQ